MNVSLTVTVGPYEDQVFVLRADVSLHRSEGVPRGPGSFRRPSVGLNRSNGDWSDAREESLS